MLEKTICKQSKRSGVECDFVHDRPPTTSLLRPDTPSHFRGRSRITACGRYARFARAAAAAMDPFACRLGRYARFARAADGGLVFRVRIV